MSNNFYTYEAASSADSRFILSFEDGAPKTKKSNPVAIGKPLINAVYAHIRAVRTLGRSSINTAEIAEALDLSQDEVKRAVQFLKEKGVKVLGK